MKSLTIYVHDHTWSMMSLEPHPFAYMARDSQPCKSMGLVKSLVVKDLAVIKTKREIIWHTKK